MIQRKKDGYLANDFPGQETVQHVSKYPRLPPSSSACIDVRAHTALQQRGAAESRVQT